jgi:hypothetical protein
MASPAPIDLLKTELEEHEKALQKSINLFKYGHITDKEHSIHKQNLTTLIDQYKMAIYKLEK